MGRTKAWSTHIGTALYRRSGGRLAGGSDDAPVLLLTVPGRRTGLPRSACVRTIPHDGGYLVWGTGSGSPTDPDWFRNLRRARTGEARLGNQPFRFSARELTGDEREQVWNDVILAHLPAVDRYARRAGRRIPVALLTPERSVQGDVTGDGQGHGPGPVGR